MNGRARETVVPAPQKIKQHGTQSPFSAAADKYWLSTLRLFVGIAEYG